LPRRFDLDVELIRAAIVHAANIDACDDAGGEAAAVLDEVTGPAGSG